MERENLQTCHLDKTPQDPQQTTKTHAKKMLQQSQKMLWLVI